MLLEGVFGPARSAAPVDSVAMRKWGADNRVPVVPGTATEFADGREFTRSIVSLRTKYGF